MKTKLAVILISIALLYCFGCVKKTPAEPGTPTATPTVTNTATITQTASNTPTITATATETVTYTQTPVIMIQGNVFKREFIANNDMASAYITNDGAPEVQATVIIINDTQSLTFALNNGGSGSYSVNSLTWNYGDTFTMYVNAAGMPFTASIQLPGPAAISSYIPGTGVTITTSASGTMDIISMSLNSSGVYSDNESSAQFAYPYTIPDSVFTTNGAGTYDLEYQCRNSQPGAFTGAQGSFAASDFWIVSILVP